jgi:hypothetical protein
MVIGSIMDEYDQASAISILAPLLTAGADNTSAMPLPQGHVVISEAFESALSVPHQTLRAHLLGDCVSMWNEMGE